MFNHAFSVFYLLTKSLLCMSICSLGYTAHIIPRLTGFFLLL